MLQYSIQLLVLQSIPSTTKTGSPTRNYSPAQLQLELADKFLQSAPFWSLFCNIGFEAVRVSFEAMTGNCFNSYFIENEVK